ncbi:unnamed protein product [Prorocentrum cordatum]|uniref:Secreted protein n=1 Tax=Prorocentrum cordatum TaxID=2364126 RepID=A0ABN9X6H2_9DINO|nr:unnamed protein product [Polarella glacialis]
MPLFLFRALRLGLLRTCRFFPFRWSFLGARGGWNTHTYTCGQGPVVLHALWLSFCRRAAPSSKKSSATSQNNHPLVSHFQAPARVRQGFAKIFVLLSVCVSSREAAEECADMSGGACTFSH